SWGRKARISGGVLSSCPGQKGQTPVVGGACSTLKSTGRRARSVAMMTQRPTMGSLRSSGNRHQLDADRGVEPLAVAEGDLAPDGQDHRSLVGALEAAFGLRRRLQRIAPQIRRWRGIHAGEKFVPLVDQLERRFTLAARSQFAIAEIFGGAVVAIGGVAGQ